MVKSRITFEASQDEEKKLRKGKQETKKIKKLASMGKVTAGLLNRLDSPIDSINRFINLALLTLDEGSQSRQFLLESKQGIRETTKILRRLNGYARRLEQELRKITD